MKLLPPALSFLLLPLLLLACSDPTLDPDKLPYRLEVVAQHDLLQIPVDLDGDGRDELVSYGEFNIPGGGAINIREFDGDIIEQVNFGGIVKRPHFLHLDHDRTLEILVPFVRHDSLFVGILDNVGDKRELIFLTEGKPRMVDDGGEIPWDPDIVNFYMVDVNHDGKDELVSVVFTGFARLPRGVLVHAFPEGYLMGKSIVGAAIRTSYLGDYDRDGRLEIAFSTRATDNGAEAGGLNDKTAHVGVFDLDGEPSLQWAELFGNTYDSVAFLIGDFTGNGTLAFLVVPRIKRQDAVEIQLIDPATRQVFQRLPMNEPISNLVGADYNQDGAFEIILLTASNRLKVLDGALRTVKQLQLAADERILNVQALPYAIDNMTHLIVTRRTQGLRVRDQELRTVAYLPSDLNLNFVDLASSGPDTPPYLCVLDDTNNRTIFFRIATNKFYLAHRYGPAAFWLISGGLLLWAVSAFALGYQRRQVMDGTHTLMRETDARGILLVYPDGCVEPMNPAARAWLGTNGHRERLDPRQLKEKRPELVEFLEEVIRPPTHRQTHVLSSDVDGTTQKVQLVAEPLRIHKRGRPYWLLILGDSSSDEKRNKAWALMAQRVAHDLMNPLTSIRLSLQHLQEDYRELVPERASQFDPHVDRITERMEQLRRMTRNFMKFVDQQDLVRKETDLNAFVIETCEGIAQGFPKDIHLEYELKEGLPPVEIDREQMISVLENLIGNAVNAMLKGGAITLKSHTDQGLRFPEHPAPGDYVTLEVQDTGEGIPKSLRSRLFEPGFTTRDEGTGLGLPLVKKIMMDHGGHIQVQSEQGLGTIICLYLPIVSVNLAIIENGTTPQRHR